MEQSQIRLHPAVFLATVLVLSVTTRAADAQSRDCSRAPRGVGGAIGRVSPYIELSQGAVDAVRRGTILVRSGLQVAGRGDFSSRAVSRRRRATERPATHPH